MRSCQFKQLSPCRVLTAAELALNPCVLQIFVPAGNNYGPELFDVDSVHGGSAWGAGTFAGATGARQPSQLELNVAEHQVGLLCMTPARLKSAIFTLEDLLRGCFGIVCLVKRHLQPLMSPCMRLPRMEL